MSCAAQSLKRALPTGGDDRGRLYQLPGPRRGLGSPRDIGDTEELRWAKYRVLLNQDAKHSIQLRAVEEIWQTARFRYRGLRYPSAGRDEDGIYHLTWAFDDLPDVTFAVEVEPNGMISWFFRDRAAGITAGTEEDGAESLPDVAYGYLERFAK